MAGRRSEKTELCLDEAMKIIKGLSYKVTLRYVFYGLLQKGLLRTKKDYKWFLDKTRTARKNFYKEWTPYSLADDSRRIYYYGWGNGVPEVSVNISHFHEQRFYVEMWFEANAMVRQFQYYNHCVTLRPFGGDYTIAKKWEIAKDLEEAVERFRKPITILYFGDYDEKGLEIPFNATRDIEKWCNVEFEFHVVGLTSEQVHKYPLDENPDKPNQYQWEALRDKDAGEIITNALEKFIDFDIVEEAREKSRDKEREIMKKIIE